MVNYDCRYNKNHTFDNEISRLEHEKICPDKKQIILCPFNQEHQLTIKNYNKHIKRCTFRPKAVKMETNNNKNNNNKVKAINSNTNNEMNNIDNSGDENKGNESRVDDKYVEDEKIFDFDCEYPDEDVFDEEDFIFKQCYK